MGRVIIFKRAIGDHPIPLGTVYAEIWDIRGVARGVHGAPVLGFGLRS